MTESKRKYLSEFAVNLYSGRWMMTAASQLMSGGEMPEEFKEVSDNSHIYIICQRPILSFDGEDFKYEGGKISGSLVYRVEGKLTKIPFEQDFPLLDGATEVKLSKYPHREIITCDSNGEVVRYLPATALGMAHGVHLSRPELANLEVLYVGQAFGDGTRSAFERLKSHSTLQKILAQSQYEAPDNEVSLLTFEYVPYRVLTQMDGRDRQAIGGPEDIERFRSIMDNPLTEHQQICLVEASLIRYFQPKYNVIYKDNFPSDKHKILESCYDLDFSGLVVEVNTDDYRLCMFSEKVAPKLHHICKVDILDPEKRHGFFHYTIADRETAKMPDVIIHS
ncbi:hypothetical protein [Vibrio viridaestus]|uniref:Uncharacterized protein n=1 Tax=Vibrio viridaestus TaxID=2487322 RepID=A0A3N9TCK6_9VIBR|nr:hypothetical protein [Vibrio viridaestus]RQW61911.1 hypothetical protein EES38_17555 [Vibrio viridaestus]